MSNVDIPRPEQVDEALTAYEQYETELTYAADVCRQEQSTPFQLEEDMG